MYLLRQTVYELHKRSIIAILLMETHKQPQPTLIIIDKLFIIAILTIFIGKQPQNRFTI
jgi:hypothetical protein